MDKKKVIRGLVTALELAAAVGIAAASCFLLYRYGRYGQRAGEAAHLGRAEAGEKKEKGEGGGSEAGQKETTGETREQTEVSLADQDDTVGELIVTEALPETVRVRILGNQFKEACHEALKFACAGGLVVRKADGIYEGEEYAIAAGEMEAGESVWVESQDETPITVSSLMRADGAPEYGGRLHLLREEAGIALINEISLEEYLCGVVSSEMPSDYPVEAQKAQAVCARTYAVNCMKGQKSEDSPEDLNDSVEFQVYNNYRASGRSRAAVEATAGEILTVSEALYYSTSCLTEHRTDLGSDEAFGEFLEQPVDEGAEYGSPWLRWQVTVSEAQILEKLAELYEFKAEQIDEIAVKERLDNGQAEILTIQSGAQTQEIEGEYQIRKVLTPEQSEVILMDETAVAGMRLLPSAFFCCEWEAQRPLSATQDDSACRVLRLWGGGYGHGMGMSQCGAAALAQAGESYREILGYYYGERE